MIIGIFSYDKKTDTYSGDVTTLTFNRANVLIKPTNISSGVRGN